MWTWLLLGSIPVYYLLRYLWELFPLSNLAARAVFITGCDSGFGRLLALKCARRGLLVYAGCLTEEGESSLRGEAEREGIGEGRLRTHPLDVTSDKSVDEAAQFVRADLPQGHELWALVNNAGVFSCYGPDVWTSLEDYKMSMDVNCWSCVRCVHVSISCLQIISAVAIKAFVPMLKRSRGRIVSVSSVAGRVSVPCGAPYAIAKYGVEAYTDAIRLELAVFGITCCLLEPGMFRTNLIDGAKMAERVEGAWRSLDAETREEYGEQFKDNCPPRFRGFGQIVSLKERANGQLSQVVDAYFHAITARFPRLRYRVGWDAILLYIPFSFLPTGLADALFRLLTRARSKKPILPAVVEKQRAQKKFR